MSSHSQTELDLSAMETPCQQQPANWRSAITFVGDLLGCLVFFAALLMLPDLMALVAQWSISWVGFTF